MRHIPAMVDMKRTPAEKQEDATCVPCSSGGPDYPYGLAISLTNEELAKLDWDDDTQVGDMVHLFCMGKVTSISKRDNEENGPESRVEIQITHIAAEDEETENEAADEPEDRKAGLSSLYRK